ncbi:MAG: hypothetical protein COS89_04050 [Deltaproteobacteria bacterium CG07_land_8_20_14_0_80_38_7]|nr:MAG: hypothetical protein COS89_04050 [Deltaproteobacteria bacterium CG07_land_8_20_14_0_80_38_7]
MRKYIFLALVIPVLFISKFAISAVVQNPLDLSGLDSSKAEDYFRKVLSGKPIEITGVVKDSEELKNISRPVLYEIPVYFKDGNQYKKYGFVYQIMNSRKIYFADDAYLSLYVKQNVLDKSVFAKGRVVDGKSIAGLPSGILFLLDSLQVIEGK